MRTSILALSLFFGGALVAQNEQPCCPPNELECACGFFVDGEFLFWFARETNLTYANTLETKDITINQGSAPNRVVAPTGFKNLSARWQPGFRIGLGWNEPCDGWDIAAFWTWYCNDKTDSVDVPTFGGTTDAVTIPHLGQKALLNPWVNAAFAPSSTSARLFSEIGAKWRLYFNQLDVELGRKYWLSSCFNLRPYAGVRAGWTKTRFRTTSTFGTTGEGGEVTANRFIDRFSSRYYGAGLLLGLQPTWYFTRCFAVYADFDASLLWGNFKVKKQEKYHELQVNSSFTVPIDYEQSYNNDCTQLQPIIDLALGLRWERTWCCNRYRTAVDLGWEHHVWFDHNHRFKTYGHYTSPTSTGFPETSGYQSYDEATGNLSLGGIVARLRWDF